MNEPVKPRAERCSPETRCPKMHAFLVDDRLLTSRTDVAMAMGSVTTGRCAWCGGLIRPVTKNVTESA